MPSFSMQLPVQISITWQPGSAKHAVYASQQLAAMQASHAGGKPIAPAVASSPVQMAGPSCEASAFAPGAESAAPASGLVPDAESAAPASGLVPGGESAEPDSGLVPGGESAEPDSGLAPGAESAEPDSGLAFAESGELASGCPPLTESPDPHANPKAAKRPVQARPVKSALAVMNPSLLRSL
jgi:hypothetical protein